MSAQLIFFLELFLALLVIAGILAMTGATEGRRALRVHCGAGHAERSNVSRGLSPAVGGLDEGLRERRRRHR